MKRILIFTSLVGSLLIQGCSNNKTTTPAAENSQEEQFQQVELDQEWSEFDFTEIIEKKFGVNVLTDSDEDIIAEEKA